jgi:NADH-quinone oxidoreductase subunit B
MYLPGCPPRPEMLIDAILKLHDKIMAEPLGEKQAAKQRELTARGELPRRGAMPSSWRFDPARRAEWERAVAEGREEQLRIEAGTRT